MHQSIGAPRSSERRSERPERRSERNSDFPAGARPGAQLQKSPER